MKVSAWDIAVIKGGNGLLITDVIEKANSLNIFYSYIFSCECSILQIHCANSCEPSTISIKIIRRRLAAID
jgi:hypothetical protein